MIIVEMSFPVSGRTIPGDNGYALYSAISRTLGGHLPRGMAIASIGGPALGNGRFQVMPETRLRIRTAADQIGAVLPLAGKFLDVAGHEIGLGVPKVRALEPAPDLTSRLVTIKGFTESASFLDAANRQLAILGVTGHAIIPVFPDGPKQGLVQRRVIRIKDKTIIGFALNMRGLSEQDSFTLMASGLGGRRHMGCGIFVPTREAGEMDGALRTLAGQKR